MNSQNNIRDYVSYRRNKAFETLKEAEILIKSGFYSTAMNRIYYAGFYIVSALAYTKNFSTSKHKQLIGFFNKEFHY